jgi:adenosylcobyric acid synthase
MTGPAGGLRGGIMVCGTHSDAGKSFTVTALCRLLARRGVKVAPFKGQNMALNAQVTADGAEIGHAQWLQAVAAGAEPEAAMNPVLLKPTGERHSQVVVRGRAVGVWSAAEYQRAKPELFGVVMDALGDLRRRYQVVVCEGAGSPAEINLLDGDIVNLRLARRAGLPAVVVGDIDRGGVFASLWGTVALLPDDLRALVRGFVINKFRGDPALLAGACEDLEGRCGVPTLGVIPLVTGADLDAEDSVSLERWPRHPEPGKADVAVIHLPHIANFTDFDPLRSESATSVRLVAHAAELGRPRLVVIPGSKATRADLEWLRAAGLHQAIESAGAPVIGVCAGAQMMGAAIDDPAGVEGEPGTARGLGWLPLTTRFQAGKVLDRVEVRAVDGPGVGETGDGYRIHHGRVDGDGGQPWLVSAAGEPVGWWSGRVAATTVHGLFENDRLRAAVLAWAGIEAAGKVSYRGARHARLDHLADVVEEHLDLCRLEALIAAGAGVAA